jgi:hypothetical protein
MAPLTADPRIEAILKVLDVVPVRPAQHDLEQAAHDILAALDDMHVHDCRGNMGWEDETDE